MNILTFIIWFYRAKISWNFDTLDKLKNHQNKYLKKYYNYLSNYNYDFKKYINKEEMQKKFKFYNKFNYSKKFCEDIALNAENTRDFKKTVNGISFGLSSGTSGNRGVFISSKKEQIKWAAIIIAKLLPNYMLKNLCNPFKPKLKIALFLRANNNLYTSLNKFGLSLSYFDLTKSFNNNIKLLNDFSPDILVAPATVLLMLAREIERNSITINPKLIISVAEVLENKDYIELQFKQNVKEIYQCTEGLLGYSCNEGNIHLNESFVSFEKQMLDEKRFIPIITDFTRTSQFFVNYIHEDILVLNNNKCKCNSINLRLEKIEGRKDEILNFNNVSIFPDSIRQLFYSLETNINNYVLEKNNEKLNIKIEPNLIEIRNEIKNKLIKLLNENNINISFIEIEFSDYVMNDYAVKTRRIINRK